MLGRTVEQLIRMAEIDYSEYVRSTHWRRVRKSVLIPRFSQCKDAYRCDDCGDFFKELEVHHLTYIRLGQEDLQHDLSCLCSGCHKKAHVSDGTVKSWMGTRPWELLTVQQAAHVVGKSISTIRNWLRNGTLTKHRYRRNDENDQVFVSPIQLAAVAVVMSRKPAPDLLGKVSASTEVADLPTPSRDRYPSRGPAILSGVSKKSSTCLSMEAERTGRSISETIDWASSLLAAIGPHLEPGSTVSVKKASGEVITVVFPY